MKFVIRILDAAGELLGWASATGVCRPGGRMVSESPSLTMVIERDGRPAAVAIEWTDLAIARVEGYIGETELKAGQIGVFSWVGPLWVVEGQSNVPLPPVTVHESVRINVPVGSLTASA